jgi:hypothetical protein
MRQLKKREIDSVILSLVRIGRRLAGGLRVGLLVQSHGGLIIPFRARDKPSPFQTAHIFAV